jgi:metal-responsive CopG/Arc/MetJ family transcriptional regulator
MTERKPEISVTVSKEFMAEIDKFVANSWEWPNKSEFIRGVIAKAIRGET